MKKFYITIRYDIPRFFSNLWRFRKSLWNYRTWDWNGTVYMLEECLKGLEHSQRTDVMASVLAPKYIKQIRTCIALCERIRNEDYSGLAGANIEYGKMKWKDLDDGKSQLLDIGVRYYDKQTGKSLTEKQKRRLWDREKYIAQQDMDYLCKLLSKYLRHWWT